MNTFGTFNASEEALAREMWEFRTCQRSDGSYYGTGGQCRKGTETDKPEKEEKKGKGGGGGLSESQDAAIKEINAAVEVGMRKNQTIDEMLNNKSLKMSSAGVEMLSEFKSIGIEVDDQIDTINTDALKSAIKSYKGGTDKFANDAMIAMHGQTQDGDSVSPKQQKIAEAKIEKATRSELEKMYKERYAITLGKDARNPMEFRLANSTDTAFASDIVYELANE